MEFYRADIGLKFCARRLECFAPVEIPWTKLKTHPICLYLDKVIMEMNTCEEPRPPNGPSPIATASGQSEYGFAEKVVEGISLSMNSIIIRIRAKAFNASFEVSQLKVYSVNTTWKMSDLRFTRIQDPQRGEILIFKEISWQMIRIEADAIQSGDNEVLSAPVRLITNQSKIRVTLKRRLKDCNVVASKLVLILDDLLWVLTDSQLKAMVQYAKSLSEAMEKSDQQRKSMASEPTQSAAPSLSSHQAVAQHAVTATSDQNDAITKVFNAFDVKETSYHLIISHLDLHICDDIHMKDKGFKKRITGGAMQLSFSQVSADYYPFHRAGDSCEHWLHHSEATKTRCEWAKGLLDEFQSNVEMLKQAIKVHKVVVLPPSPPLGSPPYIPSGKEQQPKGTSATSSLPLSAQQPKTKLMSSSIVVRVADFNIYQVSTAEQRRSSPKTMISCNKRSLYLPKEMQAVHIEFTEYYFPDGKDFPKMQNVMKKLQRKENENSGLDLLLSTVPCPNLYIQLNALQFTLDARSVLWLNQFVLDLTQSLNQFMAKYKLDDRSKPDEHVDIQVNGLMLKLIIPLDKELDDHQDLPRTISVQTSEMIATNTRNSQKCTRSNLEAMLQDFKENEFFSKSFTHFPRSTGSFNLLHQVFQRHAHEQDTKIHDIYKGYVTPVLTTCALKTSAATDVWGVYFAQFWVDYEGMKSGRGRPVSFVDSFPLSMWICQPVRFARSQKAFRSSSQSAFNIPKSESADLSSRLHHKKLLKEYYASDYNLYTNGVQKPLYPDSTSETSKPPISCSDADVHILVCIQKHVSMQINHYQYIFLLRLIESIQTLMEYLYKDVEEVTGKSAEETNLCVGVLLKSAEVALLLNPLPQTEAECKSPVSDNVSAIASDLSPSGSGEALSIANNLIPNGTDDLGNDPYLKDGRTLDFHNVISEVPLISKPVSDGATKKKIPPQSFIDGTSNSSLETPDKENDYGAVDRTNSTEMFELPTDHQTSAAFSTDPLNACSSNREEKSKSVCKDAVQDECLSALSNKRNRTVESFNEVTDEKHEAALQPKEFECHKENHSSRVGMSQSLSSGKLRERSQPFLSSFSVSYKTVKRSPSLHSLDTISIDSNILEEQLLESDGSDSLSLLEKNVGFEDILSENDQSPAECANEALGNEDYGAVSPDAISAASESVQETSKDLMSVVVFKILGLNCGVDVRGENTAVGLQINQVIPHQLGNVSVHQYLSKRSMGSDHKSSQACEKPSPEIRLRLERGPNAAVFSPLAAENGFLQCKLESFSAEFLTSSLLNLGKFVEDDCVAEVIPMKIEISNTRIHLKDDSPRLNPSAPEPVPTELRIDQLLVKRSDDGSFCIEGAHTFCQNVAQNISSSEAENMARFNSKEPKRVTCVSQATQTSPEKPFPPDKSPAKQVKSPTRKATTINKDQLLDENECLKQELAKTKMALAEAQMEKDSLLHKIKVMTTYELQQ
ncbi:UHRF1-binding protein 1-like isoform X3 [Latimeria chalumnae]|uniref:UHRF1-binding protein 1-like isoform X3 n=1 Tax=Latimeria chalumnae TaxID=7897 RepID=UPI00313DEA65